MNKSKQNKMDARARINKARANSKQQQRNKKRATTNGTGGGSSGAGGGNGGARSAGVRPGAGATRSTATNIKPNGRPGITKAKNKIKKGGRTQIDPKRLRAGGPVAATISGSVGTVVKNGANDLRQVLQQKREEKERKKALPPTLQSRLGLQSQAAREEAKKELIKQKKQSKSAPNTPNNAANKSPKNVIRKVDTRPRTSGDQHRFVENQRQRDNRRDHLVNERRGIARPSFNSPRSPVRDVRDVRDIRSPVRVSRSPVEHIRSSYASKGPALVNDRFHRYSDNYRAQMLQDFRDSVKYTDNVRGGHRSSYMLDPISTSVSGPYDHHSSPPLQSASHLAPTSIRTVAYPTNPPSRNSQPSPPAVGNSVLVTNLNPMISDEDIEQLFGDIGPVSGVQAVDPNTMLVTYFARVDAGRACQVYNNRILDGTAMKCTVIPDTSAGSAISSSSLLNRQVYTPGRMYSDEIMTERRLK